MPMILIPILFAWLAVSVIGLSLVRAAGQHAPSALDGALSDDNAA